MYPTPSDKPPFRSPAHRCGFNSFSRRPWPTPAYHKQGLVQLSITRSDVPSLFHQAGNVLYPHPPHPTSRHLSKIGTSPVDLVSITPSKSKQPQDPSTYSLDHVGDGGCMHIQIPSNGPRNTHLQPTSTGRQHPQYYVGLVWNAPSRRHRQ